MLLEEIIGVREKILVGLGEKAPKLGKAQGGGGEQYISTSYLKLIVSKISQKKCYDLNRCQKQRLSVETF